jgi:putative peptide maturation dehydrogenase
VTLLRRTRFLFFTTQDERVVNAAALLRGEARAESVPVTYAISVVRGEEVAIGREELDFVLSIPSDRWVPADGLDIEMVRRVTEAGLVLTDADNERLAELLRRDRALEDDQWNLYGSLLHFLTRWRGVDLDFGIPGLSEAIELPPAIFEATDAFVARHGPPPAAFHRMADPRAVLALPPAQRAGGLYDALAARRTTRRFDRSSTLSLDELSTVLYYVFGCHGLAAMAGGSAMLKRTSPSGGGLHPIEAYPVVAGVEGLEPGLYHYDARDHALELVAAISTDELGDVADEFVCGQDYFSSAHVLVAMTARFYRSFWKYRRHQKAYASLIMDAAHLSQTLYLVAADLGLGAFVTAAVNGANIEDRLGLDGFREGVLAVSGFGRRTAEASPLEPDFAPYVPRSAFQPRRGEGIEPSKPGVARPCQF